MDKTQSTRTELFIDASQVQPGDWLEWHGEGWYTVTGYAPDSWMSTTGQGLVIRIPVEGGLTPMINPAARVHVMREA